MEKAFKFESPEDFNDRVSQEIESINSKTRELLMKEAAQTLFSALVQETQAVEQFAWEKVSQKGFANLIHHIEWGRDKNEFIPDDTVSCKMAEKKTIDELGEGIIYEILFPLNDSVRTAKDLLENFDTLVNKNEFYIIKTSTDDSSIVRYYYINIIGTAECELIGLDALERDIELAVFIDTNINTPRPVLTADRELRLLANLIEMKLVPYKKSTL